MQRNIELLEKVMQHIDDHPEQHDQTTWVSQNGDRRGEEWCWNCGTTACFAGWTALLTPGVRWLSGDFFEYRNMPSDSEDLATMILGLTKEEAEIMFYQLDTRDQLRLAVKDLVNGDELRSADEYVKEAENEPGLS